MWLDLSKIIEMPGAEKSFEVTLDPEHLTDPAVQGYACPPEASGKVVNTAGLLNLRGTVKAKMTLICDRCGRSFDREKVLRVDVPLAADVEDVACPSDKTSFTTLKISRPNPFSLFTTASCCKISKSRYS